MVPIGVLLFIGLILGISYPIVTIIHEIGHAIPSLLFTDGPVRIQLGPVSKLRRNAHLKAGRVSLDFTSNPFLWFGGSCTHTSGVGFLPILLIILRGPFLPFILSSIFMYSSFSYDLHGFLKVVSVILFAYTIISLILDLIPYRLPFYSHDERAMFADGTLLKYAIMVRFYLEEGDAELAGQSFKVARDLDPDTYGVKDLISRAEKQVELK